MRILFLGDIMGRSGREAVEKHLPGLKERLKPDVIVINVENAAHGKGVTDKICAAFYDLGAACLTTGNHIWDQREIVLYIGRDARLLRPANFPPGTPGHGSYLHTLPDGRTILIANFMGRHFMETLDDPFAGVNALLGSYTLRRNADAIFIDFHAEATSEKMAFAHMIDGRVSAVIGTHTHIPTADAHILPGGTAFQADAGMCGDYNSVIGITKEIPIARFARKMPTEKMTPADGEGTLCGTLIETDDKTGLARNIAPVVAGPHLKNVTPDF